MAQRIVIASPCTHSPLRVPPDPVWTRRPAPIRWFVPSRAEVILSALARAAVRPARIERVHELSRNRIHVQVLPLPESPGVFWPQRPLLLARAIAHERALVAGDGDEDVRAFACEGVFEPAPGTGAFAVVGARPVVLGLVMAELLATSPPTISRLPPDERLFQRIGATWTAVIPWIDPEAPIPCVLLVLIWGLPLWVGELSSHDCLGW